jgi:hypothetical protein
VDDESEEQADTATSNAVAEAMRKERRRDDIISLYQ